MFGYILAVLSAISFSLDTIFLKKVGNKLNATFSLILIYIFVSIITFTFSILFGNYSHHLNNKSFILIFFVGLFGAIGIISFLKSLEKLSITKTLAITNFYPFIIIFLYFIIFHKKLIIMNLISMLIVFFGILLTLKDNSNFKQFKFNKSLIYPIIGAFGWGLYFIFLNSLYKDNISSFNILFYSEFSILLNIILFYIIFIKKNIKVDLIQLKSKSILINSFLTAFFSSIGVLFLILSLKKIQTSVSASIISSEIIFSTILAYFVFKEKLNKKQIFGILIVVFGLFLFHLFR